MGGYLSRDSYNYHIFITVGTKRSHYLNLCMSRLNSLHFSQRMPMKPATGGDMLLRNQAESSQIYAKAKCCILAVKIYMNWHILGKALHLANVFFFSFFFLLFLLTSKKRP